MREPVDGAPVDPELVARSLHELTALLLYAVDLDEALRLATEVTSKALPGRPAVGVTLTRDGKQETVASTTRIPALMQEFQRRSEDGPCVRAMRDGVRAAVPDASTESRWRALAERLLEHRVHSLYCFPLNPEGTAPGTLNLYFESPDGLAGGAEHLAALIADQTGLLLAAVETRARETRLIHQMRHALASRTVIDQAVGVLMARRKLPAPAAFEMLRRASQNGNRKLHDIAAAVVASTGNPPAPPRPFAEE
ncbi:GAF and ANTAR domain-containing protein [Actinomadura gamaensis]|uniref:GAF and ANTAR domain-containing protein n=1 Tax=Actinomadura gamaensis TaxID=1763541 RepID=A0ABV9U2Q6_9ACTN